MKFLFPILFLLMIACNDYPNINDEQIDSVIITVNQSKFSLINQIYVDELDCANDFKIVFSSRITKMDSTPTDSLFATGYVFSVKDSFNYEPKDVISANTAYVEHDGKWKYLDTEDVWIFGDSCLFCLNNDCDYDLHFLTWGISIWTK